MILQVALWWSNYIDCIGHQRENSFDGITKFFVGPRLDVINNFSYIFNVTLGVIQFFEIRYFHKHYLSSLMDPKNERGLGTALYIYKETAHFYPDRTQDPDA